jgi:transcriptional regulator with XRE-family HTH domain
MKSRLKQPAELERARFAERINTALAARDMAVSTTVLQRTFNERYPELAISVHAARKWVQGESIPTQVRLRALADVLQVSANWLRFGEEAEASMSKSLSAQEHMLIRQFRKLSDSQRKHALALVQSAVDLGRKR